MKLKTRVLGAAGALALAGSMMGLAAAPAHGAVTSAGSCTGSTSLATISDGAGGGLTDTTKHVTIKSKLLKAIDGSKQLLAGTCDGTKSDPLAPAPAPGQPPAQMTPKAESSSLVGSATCVATADTIDGSHTNDYTPSGKLAATMNQLDANGHPWVIQAQIAIVGGTSGEPDAFDLGGIITKGASVGATVGGNIWEDPAVLLSKTKRTIHDMVTNGTTTITSATANFTADDVGSTITAKNILPANTTISSVTNATTAVVSAAALTSASGQTAAIGLSPVSPGYNHSGYAVDPNAINNLIACADNNGATHVPPPGVVIALVGGGTGSNAGTDPLQQSAHSPLLNSAASGLTFTFGE